MARFFFSIQGTISVEDNDGTELPNTEAALYEARQTARMLLEDGFQIGRNRSNWKIRITGEGGNTVHEIRLGDTIQAARRAG